MDGRTDKRTNGRTDNANSSQAIYGNASFRTSYAVVFALLVIIGAAEGKKWWKKVLEETNNVVHDILDNLDNLSFGNCHGYQITLCDEAYNYQNATEGVYWMDNINLYYNSDNYLYLYVDSCKFDFLYLFPYLQF